MRIGELSRRTGVSVPTIKYYVREGLLPAGRLSSPNQAHYGEEHERRLRLIRALTGVGGLSVTAVADVLAAIDDPSTPAPGLLEAASKSALGHGADDGRETGGDGETAAVRAEVADLVARRGWRIDPGSPVTEPLVTAAAAMARVGHGDLFRELADAYADAAERIAEADVAYVAGLTDREAIAECVVVGTLLGDKVIAALRRIAQADATARRFETDGRA